MSVKEGRFCHFKARDISCKFILLWPNQLKCKVFKSKPGNETEFQY